MCVFGTHLLLRDLSANRGAHPAFKYPPSSSHGSCDARKKNKPRLVKPECISQFKLWQELWITHQPSRWSVPSVWPLSSACLSERPSLWPAPCPGPPGCPSGQSRTPVVRSHLLLAPCQRAEGCPRACGSEPYSSPTLSSEQRRKQKREGAVRIWSCSYRSVLFIFDHLDSFLKS